MQISLGGWIVYKPVLYILFSFILSNEWASDLYDRYASSVVYIETYINGEVAGSGSGFIANDLGIIVTNQHVIKDADHIYISDLRNQTTHKANIEYIHPDLDFAFLKLDNFSQSNDLKNRSLILGDSNILRPGHDVAAIGSPMGFTNSLSLGIVSSIRENSDGTKWIQTTTPISPGNSGGPLFNRDGEVIGINTLYIDNKVAQNINFALSIDIVKDKLDRRYRNISHSNKNQGYVSPNKQSKKKSKHKTYKVTKKELKHFRGSDLYESYCSSCHTMKKGARNKTMNLGDNQWVYGSEYNQIYDIIENGKSGTKFGWKSILSPDDIRSVTNYIMYYGESDNE